MEGGREGWREPLEHELPSQTPPASGASNPLLADPERGCLARMHMLPPYLLYPLAYYSPLTACPTLARSPHSLTSSTQRSEQG